MRREERARSAPPEETRPMQATRYDDVPGATASRDARASFAGRRAWTRT